MKKFFRGLIVVAAMLSLFTVPVSADMGPKPSVTITIENAPEKTYYMALLSKSDHYGPWNVVDESEIDTNDQSLENQAFVFFATYKDKDGYYFIRNMSKEMKGSGEYSWSYYPPEEFKLAVYCPEDGSFYLSEGVKREAFYSYFNAEFSGNTLILKEEARVMPYIINFIIRMVATILVELFIGYLMGYRARKEIKTIIIVNIITQTILNVFLIFFDYYTGGMVGVFLLPIGELFVFITELIIYLIAFSKDHKKGKTVLYTLIANILSGGLTLIAGIATMIH